MELGLARFLEMFEERFGRTVTTILLGTIGAGVFGFCADLIYEHIILPGYRVVLWAFGSITYFPLSSTEIGYAAISGMAAGAIIWLASATIGAVIHNRRRKRMKIAGDLATSILTSASAVLAQVTDLSGRVRNSIAEAKALAEQVQAEYAAVKAQRAALPPDPVPPEQQEKT